MTTDDPAPRPRRRRTPGEDGRHARAARTRAAILGALLALVEEGEVAPTAPQIAARAKVALRSVAQHFPAREQMFAAAAAHYRQQVAPRTRTDRSAPLAARIADFATRRAEVLETTRPFRRTATAMATQSPVVADGLREAARLRRAEVAAAFARELAAVPAEQRDARLDGLDVVCGGRAWDALRDDLGLTAEVATARLAMMIGAALA